MEVHKHCPVCKEVIFSLNLDELTQNKFTAASDESGRVANWLSCSIRSEYGYEKGLEALASAPATCEHCGMKVSLRPAIKQMDAETDGLVHRKYEEALNLHLVRKAQWSLYEAAKDKTKKEAVDLRMCAMKTVLVVDDKPIKPLPIDLNAAVVWDESRSHALGYITSEPKAEVVERELYTEEGYVDVAFLKDDPGSLPHTVLIKHDGYEVAVMRALNNTALFGDPWVIVGPRTLRHGDPGPIPRNTLHEPSVLERFRSDRHSVDWEAELKKKGQL